MRRRYNCRQRRSLTVIVKFAGLNFSSGSGEVPLNGRATPADSTEFARHYVVAMNHARIHRYGVVPLMDRIGEPRHKYGVMLQLVRRLGNASKWSLGS